MLIEHGLDGMARAMEIIFNKAMKLERSGFLGAGLHERYSGPLCQDNCLSDLRCDQLALSLDA